MRLLWPGRLRRFLLQKAGLRPTAPAPFRSSVRQVQMLQLKLLFYILTCQVDSLWSSCSRLGPELSLRQDLRMRWLRPRRPGGTPQSLPSEDDEDRLPACTFARLSVCEFALSPACSTVLFTDSVTSRAHSFQHPAFIVCSRMTRPSPRHSSRLAFCPCKQAGARYWPAACPLLDGSRGWLSAASGPSAALYCPCIFGRHSSDRKALVMYSLFGWSAAVLASVRGSFSGLPVGCRLTLAQMGRPSVDSARLSALAAHTFRRPRRRRTKTTVRSMFFGFLITITCSGRLCPTHIPDSQAVSFTFCLPVWVALTPARSSWSLAPMAWRFLDCCPLSTSTGVCAPMLRPRKNSVCTVHTAVRLPFLPGPDKCLLIAPSVAYKATTACPGRTAPLLLRRLCQSRASSHLPAHANAASRPTE